MVDAVRITKIWNDEKNNEVRADVETYPETGGQWASTTDSLSNVLSALFDHRLEWKEKKD